MPKSFEFELIFIVFSNMITFFHLLLLTIASAINQASFNWSSSLDTIQTDSIPITPDPLSPHHPNDFYIDIEITSTRIYLLDSTHVLRVYNKTYPNVFINNMTDYSFAQTSSYTFFDINVNLQENLLVLASYKSNMMTYLFFSLNSSGIGPLVNQTEFGSRVQPSAVFFKG